MTFVSPARPLLSLLQLPQVSGHGCLVGAWAAGFRYVVEKALRSDDLIWRPYTVLTNVTGNVTFADSTVSEDTAAFYRARILD